MSSLITLKTQEFINHIDTKAYISAMYEYGSVVYGTATEFSDLDLICIVESNNLAFNNVKLEFYIENKKIDIQFYTSSYFQQMINDHKIWALECLFLPQKHILIAPIQSWHFTLSLPKLRESVSAYVSNSWVKCKKKLMIGETYIGLKSLFHSFRMLDFGIQLASEGIISNYARCNELYHEIMLVMNTENCNWEYLKAKYQHEHNANASHFRLLAPKT